MKTLKKILIGIVAFVALLLIVALFVKKEYALEREIVINKPKQEVFDYIKLVKNSENFSVWVMADPAMRKEFKGTDGTVGFVYAWDSQDKNVGKGEQEIIALTDSGKIDYQIRFIKPFEGLASAYMATESVSDGQTKVKWGFASAMPYPMNLMCLFMNMEDILGKDLQKGLENLKVLLEK
jgi:hypothetical protein